MEGLPKTHEDVQILCVSLWTSPGPYTFQFSLDARNPEQLLSLPSPYSRCRACILKTVVGLPGSTTMLGAFPHCLACIVDPQILPGANGT